MREHNKQVLSDFVSMPSTIFSQFICIVVCSTVSFALRNNPQSFASTSPLVKYLVGGLTSLSNIFNSKEQTIITYKQKFLRPHEVLRGIEEDFRKGYLFSGAIDTEIYDASCRFTDPTLSFEGLGTFERNIKSIKPIIDRFVGENVVELNSLDINEMEKKITATWRMAGKINLPWKPILDLTGKTTYSLSDESSGGRIVEYFECWDITASAALLQLVIPTTGELKRNK